MIKKFLQKNPASSPFTFENMIYRKRALYTLDRSLFNAFGKKGYRLAAHHLKILKNLLDKYDIGLTLVIYPWPDQIFQNDLNSVHVRFWKKWTFDNHVDFINLFPYFVSKRNKEENIQFIKDHYILGDIHFNKLGNKVFATNFLKEWAPKGNKKRLRSRHKK